MTRNRIDRRSLAQVGLGLGTAFALAGSPRAGRAASRAEIDTEVTAAIARLNAMPHTRSLFGQAKAVLIFPRILSGGFIVGGQYGEGALLVGNTRHGYYNIAGASFGLLAGGQVAGLAMFFMTDAAFQHLMQADGWEIGTGPSVVALDAGLQENFTATTIREPVLAITFNQQGLMAALALNGTKISRINPS